MLTLGIEAFLEMILSSSLYSQQIARSEYDEANKRSPMEIDKNYICLLSMFAKNVVVQSQNLFLYAGSF